MNTNTPDHPVQIIIHNSAAKEFKLDLPALETVVLQENVRNTNIAIISIAGAFRKGKSFMLSFFLRYLYSVYDDEESDWLGDENSNLSGFAWRGGSRRHTTCIWIWSKIFTKTLPNGEKIGVMLMDTQGTFDSTSTMKDNVTIFSLSTMLSSVQIYNLFNNIQEDNLQHLQLFTEYGKLAKEQNNEKIFQMLLFLIRDWSYPYEQPYGFEGGRNILNDALQITEGQQDELKYVRTHLKSCYEKIDCFLMPYPGRIATVSQHFTGQLKDIDQEFKDMLKVFVPAILSPENVLIKQMNGVKVNGLNFVTYVDTYWQIFRNGSIPTAQSLLNATIQASMLSAIEESNEYYEMKMNDIVHSDKPYVQLEQFVEIHNRVLGESMQKFKNKALFGDENLKTRYYDKLRDGLQNQLLIYVAVNDSKKTKSLADVINKLSSEINQLQLITTQQISQINVLQSQIEEYRQANENEKNSLNSEILNLQNQLNSRQRTTGNIRPRFDGFRRPSRQRN